MPMEHICIVKWAHHRIVWPNQGFARKAFMCLLSLQEQGGPLTPGIQTIPSRLKCTSMFYLLWRLVKSGNLRVALSLPVSIVCTSISARHLYTNIFEPVVAYALGSVYLLCARTCGWSSYQFCPESLTPGFAKGWQRALAFTIVRHSVENSAASLDQYLCSCQTTYRVKNLWVGMNTQTCIWGFKFGPQRAI